MNKDELQTLLNYTEDIHKITVLTKEQIEHSITNTIKPNLEKASEINKKTLEMWR